MSARSAHLLGNRHLDSSARGSVLDRFEGPTGRTRVRLIVTDAAAVTATGQHLAWMVANLLARLYGVVGVVEIVAPAVPVGHNVAPFAIQGDLATTLAATVAAIAGPLLAVEPRSQPSRHNAIVVAVGQAAPGPATDVIVVGARGWSCAAYRPGPQPPAPLASVTSFGEIVDTNPTGAYLGACVAVGEVFKRALGLKPGRGRHLDTFALSAWDWASGHNAFTAHNWNANTRLGDRYLIGAGAVGQAVLATLLAAGIPAFVVTIDGDDIDDTNLNRYSLATLADIGAAKVVLADARSRGTAIHVAPYRGRWPDYADAPDRPNRPDHLVDAEARYAYEHVISAVDKNPARHAVQAYWPRHLAGGSTNGVAAEATGYDMTGPYECLKCGNPVADDDTIEAHRTVLAGLPPEELTRQARTSGVDPGQLAAYLADPHCGELGEAEFARFRDAHAGHDYAVGFVSVAAGVTVAAQEIRRAIDGTSMWEEGDGASARLLFLNSQAIRTKHRRRPACDCRSSGADAYRDLWRP